MAETAREIDRELRSEGYGVMLSRSEVARVMGVCVATVRHYESSGRLRAVRVVAGAHPRFRRYEVARVLSGEA